MNRDEVRVPLEFRCDSSVGGHCRISVSVEASLTSCPHRARIDVGQDGVRQNGFEALSRPVCGAARRILVSLIREERCLRSAGVSGH